MCATALAATQVMLHRFIPRVVAELIERHEPTIFNAVPAMLASLNDIYRTRPTRKRTLKFVQVGGAPCLVQYSLGQLEITPADARSEGSIVFIGQGMDRADIKSRFARAVKP